MYRARKIKNSQGRPEYNDKQYQYWLNEMQPFLKVGNSLYSAIDKAKLLRHKDSIYKKYRLEDWFSEKVDAYQQYPGEVVNTIFARIIMTVDEKIKQNLPITPEEMRNVRFFAEKHRSCQQFFINRYEAVTPTKENIEDLLNSLEQKDTMDDYVEQAIKFQTQQN